MDASLTAVLFPGQGSQTDDMRSDVEQRRPDLLERCAELVGEDPFARVEEGTRFQQPAIFCASLAGWQRLADLSPVALAGHSLGEFGALVAAGALSEDDGLRLVTARGRLMQEAGERNGGGMLAVKGAREDVEPLLERFDDVCLANDNAPKQVILSGPEAALEEVAGALSEEDIRSRSLPVSGAFHSPAMEPAVEEFRAEAAAVEIHEPSIPVISSVTARPSTEVADTLVSGLTSPVRWVETLHALHGRGVRRFVETGPGNVLTGLTGRTLEGVEALTVSELEPACG